MSEPMKKRLALIRKMMLFVGETEFTAENGFNAPWSVYEYIEKKWSPFKSLHRHHKLTVRRGRLARVKLYSALVSDGGRVADVRRGEMEMFEELAACLERHYRDKAQYKIRRCSRLCPLERQKCAASRIIVQ